jgi:hypothetical protein
MLIAQKPFRWRGRRIRKGDALSLKPYEARVLLAVNLVREQSDSNPFAQVLSAEPVIELLRADYLTRFGVAPDRRWGMVRLRKELDQ